MIKKDKAKEIVKFFANPIIENQRNNRVNKNAYYLDCIRLHKVNEKAILLESYHGVNFTGNAYALFRKIIDAYPEYKCYIGIKDIDDPMIQWIKKHFPKKNYEVVKYESKHYLKLLATCKYLVNDTSFMPYFTKRDEQVYLNTWHGTPLKTLGLDIKGAGFNEHKNIQKNLFTADKLAMPNLFTAEKLIQSHDLDGILNAEVANLGNARVDRTLNSRPKDIKEKYNLEKNKKIVLFAPTWKKSEEETTEEDIKELLSLTTRVQKRMGDDYHVYLKSHYFIYNKMKEMSFENHLIPNWVDSNELLAAVDQLITDYSSIFFDFLPLQRPIHFYMPDKEEYEQNRGFYLELNGLPGRISQSVEELFDSVTTEPDQYLKSYQSNIDHYLEQFCSHDNGISAPKTIDYMLGRQKGEKLFKSQKRVVLFYGGGFYNNGITNSIINLSKKFEYDKYEFVLIETDKFFKEKLDNLERLDKRVHVITKFSYTNRNIFDTISQNLLYRQGLESKLLNKSYLKRYFELDYKRVFGNLNPDVMVDFGGYNKIFAALFAFAPVKTKAIFLHNDMMGEYHKKINGRYKHKWNLKVIFSLYDNFDKIVSVSESVNEANKVALKEYITNPDEKMIAISNIINGDEIIEMAAIAEDKEHHIELYNNNIKEDYMMYDFNKTENKAVINAVKTPDKSKVNFVNVARLSPEKNHESLIRAFKQVVDNNEDSRLYILGDGPLYKHLQSLIKSLSLENHVFLLGFISNPFMFVSQCDCFVLASNYEGQGMVILEAQTLGKPVIGTNVNGINSVLDNTNGLLVENDVQSIADGLLKFIKGEIPVIQFDYQTYNDKIIKQFDEQLLSI